MSLSSALLSLVVCCDVSLCPYTDHRDDNYKSGLNWSRACFSPDGTHVAAGGSDGQVFVWNVESGKVAALLSGGHKASVACCAWSPSGAQLASVDNTGQLTLWEP